MQKTQYSYEVLVGEDCSTDGTRAVLMEYERTHKYPNLHIFYREHNMHRSPVTNPTDLLNRARGKYIIGLEGDDYWTDETKLEKQISFLEEHPDYTAVSHRCLVVDQNNHPKQESYPECPDEEYTASHFILDIFPGQLATVMYRNSRTIDLGVDWSLVPNSAKYGAADRAMFFVMLANGRIHCMHDVMSAYRHVTVKGSSYSATFRYDPQRQINYYRQFIQYSHQGYRRQIVTCAETLFFATVFHCLMHREISIRDFLGEMRQLKSAPTAACCYVIRGIRKRFRR